MKILSLFLMYTLLVFFLVTLQNVFSVSVECEVGWPIINRGGPDGPGYTFVSTDKRFTCGGQITKWTYQGKRSEPFRALVFRATQDAYHYKIIGINDIPAGATNTEVSYTIPVSERFTVESGDVIGWSFGTGVITLNGGGQYNIRYIGGHLHGGLEVDQVLNFNGGAGLREYSIAAQVMHDSECIDPLGMEDGNINTEQLSASSTYIGHGGLTVEYSRLNEDGGNGAWCAGIMDQNQWIQVNFGSIKKVTGLILQGRRDYNEWVTLYRVLYSTDGIFFENILDSFEQISSFNGNFDRTTPITNIFNSPVCTKIIRINPIGWYNWACLRFEVLGCNYLEIDSCSQTDEEYLLFRQNTSPVVDYLSGTVMAVSEGACSLECGRLNNCISFSFNMFSKECKLSISTGEDSELEEAQHFNFFKLEKRICEC